MARWTRIPVAAALALAFATPAHATHGSNVFSGHWTTNIGPLAYAVIGESEGASSLQSLGGAPCGAPTTYYRGFYDDVNGSGAIIACTRSPGRLVGRYLHEDSQNTGGDGSIDVTYSPGSFSGHYTADDFPGGAYSYSGTFQRHFPEDGCCPQAPSPDPTPSPAEEAVPKVVPPPPNGWNQAQTSTQLGPGDGALAGSPTIGKQQRDAAVTVSDPTGKTSVAAVTKPKKSGTLTRGDCLLAFSYAVGDVYAQRIRDANLQTKFVNRPGDIGALGTYFYLLQLCLQIVKEDEQAAGTSAVLPEGSAAQSSCSPLAVSLRGRGRTADEINFSSRRRTRKSASRRLRITCRRGSDGSITLRVRTRSRRTTLRKMLGKRFAVGLHRARNTTGTADVRIGFVRP